MTEANKYDELAEELIPKTKWYKREKRRNKQIKNALKHKKDNVKPLSKKDEYTVFYMKDGNQDKTYEFTVSAASFHGYPKEYQEIKDKLIKKNDCRINILEIVTKEEVEMIGKLYGLDIVLSEEVPITKVQNRKHRKKRINKKWLKKYGFTAKEITSFVFDDKVIIHPLVWEKMKESFKDYKPSVSQEEIEMFKNYARSKR